MATPKGTPEVAKAVVTIIPSMEGSRTAIADMILPQADKAGKEAGASLGGKLKDGLSTAKLAIGTAIGNIFASAASSAADVVKSTFSQAFEGFGDFQQLSGGVETLFKGSTGQVIENANKAFKTAGISANEYMETVTGFSASLLQSLGGDTEKAARIADLALTDMSDNANKMGTDFKSIEYAYQGFAKQNYTMLDNLKLGYGGTKKEMERLLKDASELSKAQGNYRDFSIDSYSDIIEAIHLVQDNIGITGTTSKEAATTIQGSMNMAKAAWDNWLVGLANPDADMSGLSRDLIDAVKTALDNILPTVKNIFAGIGEGLCDVLREAGLGGIVDFFTTIRDALNNEELQKTLGGLGNALSSIGGEFVEAIKKVAPSAEQVAEVVAWIAQSVADFLWSLTAAADYMPSFSDIFETAGDVLGNVFDIVKQLTPVISEIAYVLSALFGITLKAGWEMLKAISDVVMQVLGPPIQQAIGWLNDNMGRIQGVLFDVGNAISDVVSGITSFFTESEVGKGLLESLSGLIGDTLVGAFDLLLTAIEGIIGAWNAVVDFFENDPLGQEIAGIVTGIVEVISAALDVIHNLIKTVMGFIKGILTGDFTEMYEGAEGLFGSLENLTETGGDLIGKIIQFVMDAIGRIISTAVDGIVHFAVDAFNGLMEFIEKLPGMIVDFFTHLPENMKNIFDTVVEWIKQAFEGMIDNISHLPDRIVEFFSSLPSKLFEAIGNIPLPQLHFVGDIDLNPANLKLPRLEFYAHGGIVTQPTNAIIGEAGYPEAVIPLTSRYLTPLLRSADIGGGGDVYNQVFINDAILNDKPAIREEAMNLLEDIVREGDMNRG